MAAAEKKNTYTATEVAELQTTIRQQQAEIDELKKKLDHMNEILLNAQRTRFGQSSEKKTYVLGEDQISLFNEAELVQNHKAEEPTEETFTVKAHARKKKRTIDELAKNLPVEEVLLRLPESKLNCSKCGGTFRLIGKKLVRRELVIIPQQEKILEYYSCTYACDKCEKDTGYAHILTTQAPPALMKHSLASPSTVADVMTKKYVDGLPLARQEKIWARQGVELSRATLANWVIQCTQTWLKPLYRHMKQALLEDTVIHADETTVQVLKEDGKAATSESRMWAYASWEGSKKPIRIFEYQPDRSGKRPANFLKGFTGYLVTDGYAGYNQAANVTHCGCWAHARRKWREAMPDGATVKTSKAAVGYRYCTKLFTLDGKVSYILPKTRNEHRQNVVRPLLEEYFCWLKTVHPEKGSKLEDAVRYSMNQEQQLTAFLDSPEVPISNNLAENAIRPFVVGRKNWLFCDSVKGAESSAIVYSIVETAKANNLEPYDYLLMVLSLLPTKGKSPSHEDLERLMPWHPDVQGREALRKRKN